MYLSASASAGVVVKHEASVVEEQRFHLLETAERQSFTVPDASALPHQSAVVSNEVLRQNPVVTGAVQSCQLSAQSSQLQRRLGGDRRQSSGGGGRDIGRERVVIARGRLAVVEAHATGAKSRPVRACAFQHAVGMATVITLSGLSR